MAFLKRLGFFLVGLSIGLVLLAFFLKRKAEGTGTEFCYFPNCRVLKELRSKPLGYSAPIREMMAGGKLDSTAIARFLKDGDVDFGRSNTKAQPCTIYFIEGSHEEKEAVLEVQNCRDSVVISGLE
jgi:hypothetical protein